MRILFCNDSFPGHFEALATYFAADPSNEVLFASRYERRCFAVPNVRRAQFRAPRAKNVGIKDPLVAEWMRASELGRQALSSFLQIRRTGFLPDMVLFSGGNGVSLFLDRAFPESYRVAYLDSSVANRSTDPDGRTSSLMVQGLTLFECHSAYAFSAWQRDAFPPVLRPAIGIIPLAVDTDFFSPEAASPFFNGLHPREMVSFSLKSPDALVGSGLLRVVTALLLRRPFCHVLLACGFSESDQLYKAFERLGKECLDRLHICEFLRRPAYRDMLCASSVHICPQRTDRLLVEMLDTMSCGSVLMTALPEDENPLKNGVNMLEWPDTPHAQFDAICALLDNASLHAQLGANAREAILSGYDQKDALPRHAEELLRGYRSVLDSGSI